MLFLKNLRKGKYDIVLSLTFIFKVYSFIIKCRNEPFTVDL